MMKNMWYGAVFIYFLCARLKLSEGVDSNETTSSEGLNENANSTDSLDTDTNVSTDKTGPFIKVGHKSFFINTFYQANWFNASMYCAYHNMELATISTKEEDDALSAYFKRNGYQGNDIYRDPFLVYGTDLAHKKRNEAANGAHFSWMSTGEPLGYSNWLEGEPNHNTYFEEVEHCLEINFRGKWNDIVCSEITRYFVCQLQR